MHRIRMKHIDSLERRASILAASDCYSEISILECLLKARMIAIATCLLTQAVIFESPSPTVKARLKKSANDWRRSRKAAYGK